VRFARGFDLLQILGLSASLDHALQDGFHKAECALSGQMVLNSLGRGAHWVDGRFAKINNAASEAEVEAEAGSCKEGPETGEPEK